MYNYFQWWLSVEIKPLWYKIWKYIISAVMFILLTIFVAVLREKFWDFIFYGIIPVFIIDLLIDFSVYAYTMWRQRKYDLVIFDLDGTLINSIDDLKDSVNHILDMHNKPQRSLEEIKSFVGNGIYRLIELSFPKGTKEEELKIAYQEMKDYYKEHCLIKTKPYKGVNLLLKRLKAMGVKTAIVSNKSDNSVQVIKETYFGELIDFAIGEKEGLNRKPSKDMIEKTCECLKVSLDKVLYVGDSEVDVITAENSNIDCVIVTYGFRDRDFLLNNGAKKLENDILKIQKHLY